jgi:hypothetical protein
VLCHIHDKYPRLFDEKETELFSLAEQTPFHGVRRSMLYLIVNRSFKDYPVSFINACFEWMLSPKESPSIQVYSMYCLEKVCVLYPDFVPELKTCLENSDEVDGSKGYNAARRKVLKRLNKIQ